MTNPTLQWSNVSSLSKNVHELVKGDTFSIDDGATWHVFDRFGRSLLKGHVIVFSSVGTSWAIPITMKVNIL